MTSRFSVRDGYVAAIGLRGIETARALADVGTWAPLLVIQMRRLGVDSLPITIFIAIFTGIVLALLSSYIFTGAVPLYFVGALVGKTVMMELGPVLTGMALAGRVGASIAAELGTMKVTEQVDALETLAYDRNSYLVVPRVLAATLMFPVVTAFAMAVGVTSGWLTSVNLLDLSTPEFFKGLSSSTSSRTALEDPEVAEIREAGPEEPQPDDREDGLGLRPRRADAPSRTRACPSRAARRTPGRAPGSSVAARGCCASRRRCRRRTKRLRGRARSRRPYCPGAGMRGRARRGSPPRGSRSTARRTD